MNKPLIDDIQIQQIFEDITLFLNDSSKTVIQLMHKLHHYESVSDYVFAILFVADTPSLANDQTPQGISIKDSEGVEYSNAEMNKALVSFAIRHDMTYGSRDIHMSFASWLRNDDKDWKQYVADVEANSDDEELEVFQDDAPCLSLVQ